MVAFGILLFQLIAFSAAADNTCQFCYVGWPSSTPLDCSPYKGDEDLAVECAAEGPALQIKWFHNLSMFNTSSVPLKNDTNFFIQSVYTSATNRVRSRLRVKNVTAGNYWCQVYHNNAGYPSSQILSISDANFYSRFEACTINSPQYEPLRTPKCYSLASQGTAACNNAGVLPTTTTAIVTTTTTRLTTTTSATPGVTTTSTTSGKVVTTDNSRSITRSSKLPTRTSYPSPSPQGSLRDVPEPYQTWLFVVVALTAVFGMLIIILTIVCIGICLLRSRSNEVDCEKVDEGKSISSHDSPDNRRPSTSLTQQTEIINCLPQTAIYNTLEQDYEDIDDKDEPFSESGPPPPPAKPRYSSQSPNSHPPVVPYYSALAAADAPATQHKLHTCDPAVTEQLTGYGKLDHTRPRHNYYPKKDSPLLSGYRKLEHVARGFTQNSASSTLPHWIQNQGSYANINASHTRSSSLPDEGSIDANLPSINNSPSPLNSRSPGSRAYLNFRVIEEHEAMQNQKSGSSYHMLEDVTAEQNALELVEGRLDLGGGGVQDYEFLPTVCSDGTQSYDNLQPISVNEPDTSPARRALRMLAKDPMAEEISVDSTHSGDFTGPILLPHMIKFVDPCNPESDNHTYKALDLSSLEPDKNYAVPAAAKPKRRMKGN